MSDNPPAFPNTGNSVWNLAPTDGMTLRDWFAGQALVGVMANPNLTVHEMPIIADDCFALADAMLAERSK